ncbi:MAG: hypothetical protein AB8H86_10805 [Polyangiales bacterium]
MRQLLLGVFVLAGCTLISDADQFVGDRDTGVVEDTGPVDSGAADIQAVDTAEMDSGPPDAAQMDAGPRDTGPADTGPFTDGSCASQVDETSGEEWQDGRCCYNDSHCEGMQVGDGVYDGRCLSDSCGEGGAPALCIPSLEAIRAEYPAGRCYLNRDCGADGFCAFGDDGQYATATCGFDDPPDDPGVCGSME